MATPTMRYSNLDLTPRPERDGFVLTGEKTKRVFYVTPAGVWECSRDGEETPIELIDCNPKIHAACAKLLAS